MGFLATGTAKQGDETIKTLNQETTKAPDGLYIWRTVEDDKVRGTHAALNRTIRNWDNAPDPGEDYNCRCWAEPVEPFILKGISNERLIQFFVQSEKNVQHMYLDSKGNVTIGVGMLLPNEESALKLPFSIRTNSGERPASSDEIRRAYHKVETSSFGTGLGSTRFDPEKYQKFDRLYVTYETGLQNLKHRLPQDVRSL